MAIGKAHAAVARKLGLITGCQRRPRSVLPQVDKCPDEAVQGGGAYLRGLGDVFEGAAALADQAAVGAKHPAAGEENRTATTAALGLGDEPLAAPGGADELRIEGKRKGASGWRIGWAVGASIAAGGVDERGQHAAVHDAAAVHVARIEGERDLGPVCLPDDQLVADQIAETALLSNRITHDRPRVPRRNRPCPGLLTMQLWGTR